MATFLALLFTIAVYFLATREYKQMEKQKQERQVFRMLVEKLRSGEKISDKEAESLLETIEDHPLSNTEVDRRWKIKMDELRLKSESRRPHRHRE